MIGFTGLHAPIGLHPGGHCQRARRQDNQCVGCSIEAVCAIEMACWVSNQLAKFLGCLRLLHARIAGSVGFAPGRDGRSDGEPEPIHSEEADDAFPSIAYCKGQRCLPCTGPVSSWLANTLPVSKERFAACNGNRRARNVTRLRISKHYVGSGELGRLPGTFHGHLLAEVGNRVFR